MNETVDNGVGANVKLRNGRGESQKTNIQWGLVFAVVAGLAIFLWMLWVTKSVIVEPKNDRFARVQLSRIVGDYVQAQARSNSSPDQVAHETKNFMVVLERELKNRTDKGSVLLVNEAVVASNLPDITDDIKKAVYAQVSMPRVASSGNSPVMASMQQAMVGAPVVEAGQVVPSVR